jgi:hypothetical protein
MRQKIVVAVRGAESVEALPVTQRQVIVAAEIVLQPRTR